MKTMSDIQKDRLQYYQNNNLNTVHRSSLLIPKLKDKKTYFSFLNHYLIKRGIEKVILKLSVFDINGNSTDALTFEINAKKVYTFCLEEIFDIDFVSGQVEFFSTENFYIPYPAVMINHVGDNCINTVHAYNRILNDPREIDKVGSIHVKEAAIDLILNNYLDTFIIFHAGIENIIDKELSFTCFSREDKSKFFTKKIILNLPKMTTKKINLSEVFKNSIKEDCDRGKYIVKIEQPDQIMFYGRLFVGVENKKYDSFSGNHSYYDNSEIKEYFDDKISYKTHPYFKNSKNKIIIYPIISPSVGKVSIYTNSEFKNEIKTSILKTFDFKTCEDSLIIDVANLVKEKNIIGNVKTFTLEYQSTDKKGAPSRVNYQLIYGPEVETGLDASINTSLFNKDVLFSNKSKVWIQLLNNKKYSSFLGVCFLDNIYSDKNEYHEILVDIYDEKGLLESRNINLRCLDSIIISNAEFNSESPFLWLFFRSKKSNLCLQTYSFNKKTFFASGEHSFGSW